MVSHDRYLIEACADQLWVVADRTVSPYDDDLDNYRRTVLSSRGAQSAARDRTADPRAREKNSRPKSERRTSPKQRVSETEAEIVRISEIIAKIDAALAMPDLYQRDPKQAAQLGKARTGAAAALQRAEDEWLAASTALDEEVS
jgi:ATP-binding cassette subfamily F protein 3